MKSLLITLITSTLQAVTSTNSNFYLIVGSSHDSQPTCLGVDSHHTYLCTDSPRMALNAIKVHERQVQGISSQDRTMINTGVNQRLSGSEEEINKVREVLADMMRYMDEEVMTRSEYEHVRDSCRNDHELCAFWTSVGECESNRVFMLQNCAAACRLCLLKNTNMIGEWKKIWFETDEY